MAKRRERVNGADETESQQPEAIFANQWWRHENGEVYAVQLAGDAIAGIHGPVSKNELTIAAHDRLFINGYTFAADADKVAWATAEREKFVVIEPTAEAIVAEETKHAAEREVATRHPDTFIHEVQDRAKACRDLQEEYDSVAEKARGLKKRLEQAHTNLQRFILDYSQPKPLLELAEAATPDEDLDGVDDRDIVDATEVAAEPSEATA